jgi:FkbM family methyltransferase
MENNDLINLFFKIQQYIRPEVSIEIGAYEATFSKKMIDIVPNGNVWAFEASPYVYQNFYPINNVNYLNKAISNTNDIIKFQIQSDSDLVTTANNSIINRNEDKNYLYIDVESVTLDSMFKEYKNICLWIDCEGANKQVLEGSVDILKNVSSIFIEVEEYEFWKDQWLYNDVYQFLKDNDFILLDKDNEYGSSQYNCIFIKKNWSIISSWKDKFNE